MRDYGLVCYLSLVNDIFNTVFWLEYATHLDLSLLSHLRCFKPSSIGLRSKTLLTRSVGTIDALWLVDASRNNRELGSN